MIADDLGCNRSEFPHSMYLVAGSQAEKPKDNCVIVMKVQIILFLNLINLEYGIHVKTYFLLFDNLYSYLI